MSALIPRERKGEKNVPPPPGSFSLRGAAKNDKNKDKPRRVRNVTTAADHAELERCYTFVPSSSKKSSSWQERMVDHYHSHLYKEYVLADLRRPCQVGLRWRTKTEVQQGKGHESCGNKHCPSHTNDDERKQQSNNTILSNYYHASSATESQERELLDRVPHGLGLHDYEVNFSYAEGGVQKNELVKLRLCLQCAPLLFHNKGGALGARRARQALDKQTGATSSKRYRDETDSDASSLERRRRKRSEKKKSKHKHRKETRRSPDREGNETNRSKR